MAECEVCDLELPEGYKYSVCGPCIAELREALADRKVARVIYEDSRTAARDLPEG